MPEEIVWADTHVDPNLAPLARFVRTALLPDQNAPGFTPIMEPSAA